MVYHRMLTFPFPVYSLIDGAKLKNKTSFRSYVGSKLTIEVSCALNRARMSMQLHIFFFAYFCIDLLSNLYKNNSLKQVINIFLHIIAYLCIFDKTQNLWHIKYFLKKGIK